MIKNQHVNWEHERAAQQG